MIKCPHCGADASHLTADIDVTISCTVDENGWFHPMQHWNNAELDEAVHQQGGRITLFCNKCGWDVMPAELSDDGLTIIPKEIKKLPNDFIVPKNGETISDAVHKEVNLDESFL